MSTHPYPTEHDPRTFTGDAYYVWRYSRGPAGGVPYVVGRAHGPYDRTDGELALATAVHNFVNGWAERGSRAIGTRYRGHDAYVCYRQDDDEDSPTGFLVLTVGGPFPWWDVSRALRPRRTVDESGHVSYPFPDALGPREDSDMDGGNS